MCVYFFKGCVISSYNSFQPFTQFFFSFLFYFVIIRDHLAMMGYNLYSAQYTYLFLNKKKKKKVNFAMTSLRLNFFFFFEIPKFHQLLLLIYIKILFSDFYVLFFVYPNYYQLFFSGGNEKILIKSCSSKFFLSKKLF